MHIFYVLVFIAVMLKPMQAIAASNEAVDEAMLGYAAASKAYRNVQLILERTYSKPSGIQQYQVLLRREGGKLDIYESEKNGTIENIYSGRVPRYRQQAVLVDDQLLIYTPSGNGKKGAGATSVKFIDPEHMDSELYNTLHRYLDHGTALIGILPANPPISIENVQATHDYVAISKSRGEPQSDWFCVRIEREPFTYDLWLDPGVEYQPREMLIHAIMPSDKGPTELSINITNIEYNPHDSIWVPSAAEVSVSYVKTDGRYDFKLQLVVRDIEFNPDFDAIRGAFTLDADESNTFVASYDAPQVPLKLINGKVVPAVDAGMKQSIDSVITDIRSGKYKGDAPPKDPFDATVAIGGWSWKEVYGGIGAILAVLTIGAWKITRRIRVNAS